MSELNDELSEKLKRIESKIDSLKGMLRHFMESEKFFDLFPPETPSSYRTERGLNNLSRETVNVYLLKLPDSLRQTMFAMDKLRQASAFEVAKVTSRSRSVESFHLNQLERMGYLVKFRRGKRIYFKVPKSLDRKGGSKAHREYVL